MSIETIVGMGNISDENRLLFRLIKHDTYWRMDTEGFSRFINHVRKYFQEYDHLSDQTLQKVIYAEIDEDELVSVCFLFAALIPNKETLMLTEFSPRTIDIPWGNSFTFRLCVETGESRSGFISVRMTMKQPSSLHCS